MKKNLAVLALSVVIMSSAFGEELEKVKRRNAYNGKDAILSLGKLEEMGGLKFKKVVKEDSIFGDKAWGGYELQGKRPFINFIVSDAAGAETLSCELEKVEKSSKKLIEKPEWTKHVIGAICKGHTASGDYAFYTPTKVKKIFAAKEIESNKFNNAQTACVKNQVAEIEKSELYNLYYNKRDSIGIYLTDFSKSGTRPLVGWLNEDSTYFPAVGESNYAGSFSIKIDKSGRCKFISASDIDKEIVAWMTNNAAISFIDKNDIAIQKEVLKARIKSREEESRIEKDQIDSKKIVDSQNDEKGKSESK